jgi:nanoRNase/pAp phosphatase (c-di-AMP/oligoRNAs hydrolase)
LITDLTRQRFAELAALLASRTPGAPWLVLTHDNPDPDALVSAALLSRLLRRGFHRHVETAYGGIIGRAENQELFRSLRLGFAHVRRLDLSRVRCFALVDTQPRTGNNQLPPGVVPDVVLDHHPLRKATQQAPFFDVRPDYGATASLAAEYLEAAGLPLTRALATGLAYAIRSETRDFGREAAGPDRAAYDAALPKASKSLLSRIQHAALPLPYFKDLHQALENLESVGSLVVSHLGAVEQPDIVPEIADLLLRMEGKTWSLATGLFGDRVYLSIRTTNPRADAGQLMRRLVGRRGKGGGHGMAAGGWVAAPKSLGGDPRALQRQLAAGLAKALNKNPEKLAPLALDGKAEPKAEPPAAAPQQPAQPPAGGQQAGVEAPGPRPEGSSSRPSPGPTANKTG